MRGPIGRRSWDRILDSKHGILDDDDIISRLPDELLQHIVSFLPTTDKDRVRVLARKWWRLYAQSQKMLCLTGRRLAEQEFESIFKEFFPSVEYLMLRECTGIKKLRLSSYNMKRVEYAGNLENLNVTASNLEYFDYAGPPLRPCTIELGICKHLKIVHVLGVSMKNMMFKDCNSTFPFLQALTISECDMTGPINISSNSLKELHLLTIQNSVGVTIDAPNMLYFVYNGSTIVYCLNLNLPRLTEATIELTHTGCQNYDKSWFCRLFEMLLGLKHAETLLFETNSIKTIVIPKKFRKSFGPPLKGIKEITVSTNEKPCNSVAVTDGMLWICPRVKNLVVDSNLLVDIKFKHRELSGAELYNACDICTSHPSRCWRHSVIRVRVNVQAQVGLSPTPTPYETRTKLVAYFAENFPNAAFDYFIP